MHEYRQTGLTADSMPPDNEVRVSYFGFAESGALTAWWKYDRIAQYARAVFPLPALTEKLRPTAAVTKMAK
jgi:hypothetical protein